MGQKFEKMHMHNPVEKLSGLQVSIILFVSGIIIVSRDPIFLLSPRIWAEEGSIFLRSYLENGLAESILLPQLGYFSLLNNLLPSVSAELFGLKRTAYGTTISSLVIMMICVSAPLYLHSSFWSSNKAKLFLLLGSLLVATPEIWLNTINLQFYLGLYGCYYLLSDVERLDKTRFYVSLTIFFFACLTGVTTVVLFPLFLYRYVRYHSLKSNRIRLSLSVLVLGLLVQSMAFIGSLDGSFGDRLSFDNLTNLPYGLLTVFFYFSQGNSNTISFLLVNVAVIGVFFYTLKYAELRFLAFTNIYVGCLFAILSLGMTGGGRYAFVPSMLTILFFVNVWMRSKKHIRHFFNVFGVLFVLYKVPYYFSTEYFYDPDWPSFSEAYSSTAESSDDRIRIHPMWEHTDWTIDLSRIDNERIP